MISSEYFEHGNAPIEKRMKSDWLYFCSLVIISGKLAVLDPTLFDGPILDLSPGTYQVQVKMMNWADDRRISRLRVTSGENEHLGLEIGTVSVDFAQVGVGDW